MYVSLWTNKGKFSLYISKIVPLGGRNFYFVFKVFFFKFFYFEREREAEGERESQAGSALSVQSLMWGLNPQTMRS